MLVVIYSDNTCESTSMRSDDQLCSNSFHETATSAYETLYLNLQFLSLSRSVKFLYYILSSYYVIGTMRYDLHIHSIYSDGVLHPEKIVRIARDVGLSGIAITDHNTIKGGLEAKKSETADFKIIVGSEIKTNRGDLTGIFLTQEIRSRDFRAVIREIHEQGGVAIIPHPFDRNRRSAFKPSEEETMLVDALEVFNSRCMTQSDNDRALYLARKLHMGQTAGSDAHLGREIGNAGIITDAQDLRTAIETNDLEFFGRRSSSFNKYYTVALNALRVRLR
jgi:predicted metal-dependent phosphoesterase TrpH